MQNGLGFRSRWNGVGGRLVIEEPVSGLGGVGGALGLVGSEGRREWALIERDDTDGAFEGDGDGPFQFDEIRSGGVGGPDEDEGWCGGDGVTEFAGPAVSGAQVVDVAPGIEVGFV